MSMPTSPKLARMFSRYPTLAASKTRPAIRALGATPQFFDAAMHPLAPGVQGGASHARIGVLRYVQGSETTTLSSWRIHDVEEWG